MAIRLNSILIVLVLSVLMFFFLSDKNGTYLNGSEAQIYLFLAVTLTSLIANSYIKNVFLEVVNVVVVIFYVCRIPFIFSEKVASDVLSRFVDQGDIPFYLFILSVQYLLLVLCVLVVNPRANQINELSGGMSEKTFVKIIVFSFFVILANIVRVFFFYSQHEEVLGHFFSILKTIFTEANALMLLFVSMFMVGKDVLKKHMLSIVAIVLLALFASLYVGSKSGLLQVVLFVYLAVITVRGPLVFRLQGLVVAMVLMVASICLFFIGKVFRIIQVSNESINLEKFIYYFERIIVQKFDFSEFLAAFSYRLGYLDFFIQKISNPVYEPYVSFSYYAKTVIDKITPGFDIFNVAFASRAIHAAYHGQSINVMNSELITVFGEGYILLGFFSFVLYLSLLLLIKWALRLFKNSSPSVRGVFFMYLLYSFYWWLTGSGVDMLVALSIYHGIFTFCVVALIWCWEGGGSVLKSIRKIKAIKK